MKSCFDSGVKVGTEFCIKSGSKIFMKVASQNSSLLGHVFVRSLSILYCVFRYKVVWVPALSSSCFCSGLLYRFGLALCQQSRCIFGPPFGPISCRQSGSSFVSGDGFVLCPRVGPIYGLEVGVISASTFRWKVFAPLRPVLVEFHYGYPNYGCTKKCTFLKTVPFDCGSTFVFTKSWQTF